MLHVATRKGLFFVEGGAVVRTAFLGEPVSAVLHDRRDGAIYAALRLGHFGPKLHRSDDGGATWTEVAAPAFAKLGDEKAPSVDQIWTLERADHAPGALWAGTIPAALWRSDDRGASWTRNEPLWNVPGRDQWFGGGYPDAGIHSICVDPRDARRVLVGVSCGGVWETVDGGASWQVRCKGLFAEYMPPDRREDPGIQDPHRIAQSPSRPDVLWMQHHNGMFRSVDGARTWSNITTCAPSHFGFAVAVHPERPDTAWFVPAVKDERRIPVDGKLVVARTTDGGASFEQLRRGLPQEHAYDLVYRHALDVDAGGDRLAIGSTTGGLWLSDDGGDSWRASPARLPPIYAVRFA